MKHPTEPADSAIALFCHPRTGAPEDAWYRDDDGATAGGYGDQHWYPIGRTAEDPPETWFFLTRDKHETDTVLIVTGTTPA